MTARLPSSKGSPAVLVAEDNLLLAELVCDLLCDAGLKAVGPAGRLDKACALAARTDRLTGAVLDIKLHDELIFPVCTILAQRKVPFIFLTGIEDPTLIPAEFAHTPTFGKPFDSDALKTALERFLLYAP